MYASLIDPIHPNLTIGVEYNIDKKFSVAFDYSHIFRMAEPFNQNNINSGFILKPSFKFFKSDRNNEFLEFDIFWKKQKTYTTKSIGQEYQNGFPTYYKIENYTLVKDVFGINFKYGQRFDLLDKKIFVEPYIGLGIRMINRKIQENPEEIMKFSTAFFGEVQTNKTYWGISVPMGIRLVLPIK